MHTKFVALVFYSSLCHVLQDQHEPAGLLKQHKEIVVALHRSNSVHTNIYCISGIIIAGTGVDCASCAADTVLHKLRKKKKIQKEESVKNSKDSTAGYSVAV